jgi:hypothetical protein
VPKDVSLLKGDVAAGKSNRPNFSHARRATLESSGSNPLPSIYKRVRSAFASQQHLPVSSPTSAPSTQVRFNMEGNTQAHPTRRARAGSDLSGLTEATLASGRGSDEYRLDPMDGGGTAARRDRARNALRQQSQRLRIISGSLFSRSLPDDVGSEPLPEDDVDVPPLDEGLFERLSRGDIAAQRFTRSVASTAPEFRNPFVGGHGGGGGPRASVGAGPLDGGGGADLSVINQRLNTLISSQGELFALQIQGIPGSGMSAINQRLDMLTSSMDQLLALRTHNNSIASTENSYVSDPDMSAINQRLNRLTSSMGQLLALQEENMLALQTQNIPVASTENSYVSGSVASHVSAVPTDADFEEEDAIILARLGRGDIVGQRFVPHDATRDNSSISDAASPSASEFTDITTFEEDDPERAMRRARRHERRVPKLAALVAAAREGEGEVASA